MSILQHITEYFAWLEAKRQKKGYKQLLRSQKMFVMNAIKNGLKPKATNKN